MATGVPGRLEYTGSKECVWCSSDGAGMLRIEIRQTDQEAILYTPQQAFELAKVLQEIAGSIGGYRIEDDRDG